MKHKRLTQVIIIAVLTLSTLACQRTEDSYPELTVDSIDGFVGCSPTIVSNGDQMLLYIEKDTVEGTWTIACPVTVHYMVDGINVASTTEIIGGEDKYFKCLYKPEALSIGTHTLSVVLDIECDEHKHCVRFNVLPSTFTVTQ